MLFSRCLATSAPSAFGYTPERDAAVLDWIRAHFGPRATLLGICGGTTIVADTGLANRHLATSNPADFDYVEAHAPSATWLHNLRYVDDGAVVPSSAVASGRDATLLHVVDRFARRAKALDVARQQLPAQSIQLGTVIKSPNGQFSLSITDDGILMQGPGGSVHIDQTQVEVKGRTIKVSAAQSVSVSGTQSVSVTSSALLNVSASARIQVTGAQVALNGGCEPVARYNDSTMTFAGYGPSPGVITSGSPTVLAC